MTATSDANNSGTVGSPGNTSNAGNASVPARTNLDALAGRALNRRLEQVAASEIQGLLKQRGSPLHAAAADVRKAVTDAVARLASEGPPAPDGKPQDDPPEPHYPNVAEFVDDFLLKHWRHKIERHTMWCPQWWLHEEAISRLEGLWQAWETLRLDGTTGIAQWWRDYADPTMAALTAPHGTFHGCETQHTDDDPWPHDPPPHGLFRDRDHPEEQ